MAAKLQKRPRKLKNVLTRSFREKSPRKVMGRLLRSVDSVMTFNGELRDSTPLASGQYLLPAHSPPIERIHDSQGKSDIESPSNSVDQALG